jgi:hypothetical protein
MTAKSGYQRLKLTLADLQRANAALEIELKAERANGRPEQRPTGPLEGPKSEQFVDYAAIKAQRKEEANAFRQEFKDLASEFPDAEEATENLFKELGGHWNPDVLDILYRAKHRAVIHYYLSKRIELAKRLNVMDKTSAALLVGELDRKAGAG